MADLKTYSSFSGADITAVMAGKLFATLQAISYSVTREKGPVYTMGSPDPRAFARGKRAIAGTLVFVTIDKSSLIGGFLEADMPADNKKFYGKKVDSRASYTNVDTQFDNTTSFETISGSDIEANVGAAAEYIDIYYADQILPFNVNLSAVNEAGEIAKKSIIGVELMNEGGGVSVDDLVLEEQYTYICRYITPWMKVTRSKS